MGFTFTDYVRAGFGPGVTAAQVAALNTQYGVQTVDSDTFADGTSVYTLRVPAGGSYTTLEVANAYYLDSLTDWAVPDAYADFFLQSEPSFSLAAPSHGPVVAITVFSGMTIDDPLYPDQWHLNNTGQSGITPDIDIDADLAWGITTGSDSVTAAIVDSGVQDHVDFEAGQRLANGWTAPALGGGDGSPVEGTPHGQQVAGLLAADFNAIGVRGTSDNTRILPITINDEVGFAPVSEIAEGIDIARERGAHLMNHSWGSEVPDFESDDIAAAFERAIEDGRGGKGIVMVAAAGNNGEEVGADFVAFPASLPGVIAVGGVTSENNRGPYSPIVAPAGDRRPDVFAPSSGGLLSVTTMTLGTYTSSFSKTSAASPQVAGIAASSSQLTPN